MAAKPYAWPVPPPPPAAGWPMGAYGTPFASPLASPFASPYGTPYGSPYASPQYSPATPLFPSPWLGAPWLGNGSPYANASPLQRAPSYFGAAHTPAAVPGAFTPAPAPFLFTPAPAPGTFTPAPAPGMFTPAPAPGMFSPAANGTPPSLLLEAPTPDGTPAVRVAPWLAQGAFGCAPLVWDVRSPPQRAQVLTERGALAPLAGSERAEQATFPGNTGAVSIALEGGPPLAAKLWPSIPVSEVDATVDEVLNAIHAFFHARMNQEEVDAARAAPDGTFAAMVAAMTARCRASPGLAEVEWAKGLRRVDVLGDSRAFGGLRVEYAESGEWSLRLALLPVAKE